MTNPNYTHLLVIVDRSGSMFSIARDMVGALDQLFKDQAEQAGTCLVDYVQFDDQYEVAFTDKPLSQAKAVLYPRGSTALLDAVGKAVTELGTKLSDKSEDDRPGLVQVVVVTDGYENASREWTADKIKSLIRQQEDQYNWDFIFLGANMDAVAVGTSFGFDASKSLTYSTNNTKGMTMAASGYVTRSRNATLAGASVTSNAFTEDEREDQGV